MKNRRFIVYIKVATCVAAFGSTLPASVFASISADSVLRLPRLAKPGTRRAAIAEGKVVLDSLAPNGRTGAHSVSRAGANWLQLDPDSNWGSALELAGEEVVFVSFLLLASEQTKIDIGGSTLVVKQGRNSAFMSIAFGKAAATSGNTPHAGILVHNEPQGKSALVQLPVITVRLDYVAGVWDLFVFERMVAENIPLSSDQFLEGKKIKVHAGSGGAVLRGLVKSATNPLFEDRNSNGLEDASEKLWYGQLLPTQALTERSSTLPQRKEDEARNPIKGWGIKGEPVVTQ